MAFGDEEGVRFRTTLTGSRALAGNYPEDALDQRDAAGVSMRDALKAFGGDPDQAAFDSSEERRRLRRSAYRARADLEAEGLPLGIVTAINGATRLEVAVDGVAGHAGATPMRLRRDALTAAAEMALAIEARARSEPDLVATVGRFDVWPGATNVIPGVVKFSIDVRAPADARRAAAVADLDAQISAIAAARGVRASIAQAARSERICLRSAHRRRAGEGGRGDWRSAAAACLQERATTRWRWASCVPPACSSFAARAA